MFPSIGSVPAYSVAYLGGIALHLLMALWLARRLRVPLRFAALLGLSYAVCMTLGARLLFDLLQGLPLTISEVIQPGYLMQGGLWGGPMLHLGIAGPLALATANRRAALDLTALALPLPMAAAKVGCFVNGCCFGAATSLPWAVTFPLNPGGAPSGVLLHPAQLYEVALLAAAFAVIFITRSPRWNGGRLLIFLAIYGLGRGAIEFVRGDSADRIMVGPLTVSQLICFSVAALAAVPIALFPRRRSCPEAG